MPKMHATVKGLMNRSSASSNKLDGAMSKIGLSMLANAIAEKTDESTERNRGLNDEDLQPLSSGGDEMLSYRWVVELGGEREERENIRGIMEDPFRIEKFKKRKEAEDKWEKE